mmetsp:Transcript_14959/g.26332  ORF Transcript_14959/g.26332 Transcript_14959/m.26332 type:complete len:203 (+) Transcript_14959:207-815(+)
MYWISAMKLNLETMLRTPQPTWITGTLLMIPRPSGERKNHIGNGNHVTIKHTDAFQNHEPEPFSGRHKSSCPPLCSTICQRLRLNMTIAMWRPTMYQMYRRYSGFSVSNDAVPQPSTETDRSGIKILRYSGIWGPPKTTRTYCIKGHVIIHSIGRAKSKVKPALSSVKAMLSTSVTWKKLKKHENVVTKRHTLQLKDMRSAM